jgi:HlyD family secretion protein
MKMNKSQLLPILFLVILAACGGKKEEKKEKPLSDYKLKEINELIGIARIEPAEKIYPIGAEVNGTVVRICVREGDPVKKGQLLMELNDAAESAQVAQSTSKVNTRNEKIKGIQAKISALYVKLDIAKTNSDRDNELAKADAITNQKAFDTETIFRNLQQDIKVAQADLQEAKASLGELSADTKYFNEIAGKKKIYAPADGMLLSLDVKPGQTIAPGTKIADFAPAGGLIAITEIDELFAMKVKVGMKVKITAQGTKDVLTTGTVTYTSPFLSKKSIFSDKADNLEDRRVREVRILIDDVRAVLIGSRVEAIIKL